MDGGSSVSYVWRPIPARFWGERRGTCHWRELAGLSVPPSGNPAWHAGAREESVLFAKGRRMTAIGVSSGIFGDIFSTEPMRRIFADENRIQKYLDIEAALARVQARLGIIPQNAGDEILRHCSIAEYDFARL